jgi:hypothetical protein
LEVGAQTLPPPQLLERSELYDAAGFEHADDVGIQDRQPPGRDHERGSAFQHAVDVLLDRALGPCVERTSALADLRSMLERSADEDDRRWERFRESGGTRRSSPNASAALRAPERTQSRSPSPGVRARTTLTPRRLDRRDRRDE